MGLSKINYTVCVYKTEEHVPQRVSVTQQWDSVLIGIRKHFLCYGFPFI